MFFLGMYTLFAITTAIVSLLELLGPVISFRVKNSKPVEHVYLTYFVFFCIALLIAPLVFLSCIVPSMGERFRDTLEKGLFEEAK